MVELDAREEEFLELSLRVRTRGRNNERRTKMAIRQEQTAQPPPPGRDLAVDETSDRALQKNSACFGRIGGQATTTTMRRELAGWLMRCAPVVVADGCSSINHSRGPDICERRRKKQQAANEDVGDRCRG